MNILQRLSSFENAHLPRFENARLPFDRNKEYCRYSFNHAMDSARRGYFGVASSSMEFVLHEKRMAEEYPYASAKVSFQDIVLDIPGFEEKLLTSTFDKGMFKNPLLSMIVIDQKEIQNMIAGQKEIFGEIDRFRFSREEIDLSHLSHLSYKTLRGSLSYCKTIKDPDYHLEEESLQLFAEQVKDGFCDGKKRINALALYSGQSYTELLMLHHLVKSGHVAGNAVFADSSSSLVLPYMFYRQNTPYRIVDEHGTLTEENLARLIDNSKEHYGVNLVIANNGLTCIAPAQASGIVDGIRSGHVDTFITVPTIFSSTGQQYYGKQSAFLDHFVEDILLAGSTESFRPYVETKHAGIDSYVFRVGIELVENVSIYGPEFSKERKLKKGTRIMLHNSYRYGPEDIDNLGLRMFGDIESGMVALNI